MKVKLSILVIVTMLLNSCQNKSSTIESGTDSDSLMVSENIEQQTLNEWFALNKESDSIIASTEIIIKQNEIIKTTNTKRNKGEQKLQEVQLHLAEFKKRVNYIKDYETRTETFDQSVLTTLDSLKGDYFQERHKLETALREFQEFQNNRT